MPVVMMVVMTLGMFAISGGMVADAHLYFSKQTVYDDVTLTVMVMILHH